MKPAKATIFLSILAMIIAVSSSISVAGESHYRWSDKWGNPVHSDRPPPKGVDYEVVSSGTSLVRQVDSSEGAVPARVEPSIDNDFEQVETNPKAVEKFPEICERAQQNLTTLNTAARIRLRDDQGEYRYISEEEKETQRNEAIKLISVHCE